MDILHTIILGIVEGITEFLPISSTFHLIWTSRFMGIEENELVKLFNVFIQSGAILAVVFLYWKEILTNRELFTKLVISLIPTAVVGLVLYDMIKGIFFESELGTTIIFILVGFIFLLVEYLIVKKVLFPKNDIKNLTYSQALLVGLFQALAVIPGVSRAGAVLVGMMILGFNRSESAKYSFMLSIPTIAAASLFDFIEMRDVVFASTDNMITLIIGSLVALVSAFIGVKWLIRYLQNHSLAIFGWYRIILGIILILFLII